MQTPSSRTQSRGLTALTAIAVAAVVLGTLGLSGRLFAPVEHRESSPFAATDAGPSQAGGDWLAAQLTDDGRIYNRQYDFYDYGLGIDTGLALDALGGHAADVASVGDGLAAHVDDYITGGSYAPDDRYAGSIAKSAVMAEAAGDDPTSFGGRNLIYQLQQRTIMSSGATDGRIQDKSQTDYANVVGQTYAVRALDGDPSSTRTADATSFLLLQQCSAGWFRLYFSPKAQADQTCDGASDATPAVDATALAVLALTQRTEQPQVPGAIDDAVAWLASVQRADGGFGDGAGNGPNTNSTGLAAQAFAATGRPGRAADAATWIRRLQTRTIGSCPTALDGEDGAVAFNKAALDTGRSDGIVKATRDQWRRAGAQAVPGLLNAPAAPGGLSLEGPSGYQRAGSTVQLAATGLAPAQGACLARGSDGRLLNASSAGSASPSVTLPNRTAEPRWTLTDDEGRDASLTIPTLGRARFAVTTSKARVPLGDQQRLSVDGLAPAESVRLRYQGDVIASGTASDAGTWGVRFRVKRPTGPQSVTVLGQFADLRFGSADFTVVR